MVPGFFAVNGLRGTLCGRMKERAHTELKTSHSKEEFDRDAKDDVINMVRETRKLHNKGFVKGSFCKS